jgi:hypothetical protein
MIFPIKNSFLLPPGDETSLHPGRAEMYAGLIYSGDERITLTVHICGIKKKAPGEPMD